jgi:transposase
MSSYTEKRGRKQVTFLPNCLDDYVSETNPVRFIDAYVDSLDMKKLGFLRAEPAVTGRPAYDPRDLLKLYIYGYMNKIRSSRKLMTECRRNIELIFLLCELTPDFRTIADFRKDNADAIKGVFKEFVLFCDHVGLYEKKLIAIDGTKIRAWNAADKCYNKDILLKKIERINAHIEEYMAVMNRHDKDGTEDEDEEESERKLSKADIAVLLSEMESRKEKYEGYLSRIESEGITQILETDPEAHRMHMKDGFHCGYNVQAATDAGSHLIAAYEVTNHTNDVGKLTTTAEIAKENLNMDTICVVADKGYDGKKDILDAVLHGIAPVVGLKYNEAESTYNMDYVPYEITEKMRRSTEAEDIKTCLGAGLLPYCFEDTCVSVETHEISGVACFTRLDEKTVLCPAGKKLWKTRRKNGKQTIFRSSAACAECKCRCTASSNPKEVSFVDGTEYVPVQVYGNMKYVVNYLPKDAKLHHNSRSLARKTAKKRVVLHVRTDTEKLHTRMCTVEHPFGSVKRWNDAGYFLCRGKRKVSAEVGLSFLAYNIKRAMNMVGMTQLMEAVGE